MQSFEWLGDKVSQTEKLHQQFAQLRHRVHESMKDEEQVRLKENPTPTEEEIYIGAFDHWLEPQVRDAIHEMYRKGYVTGSSGFYEDEPEVQHIGGIFSLDDGTKDLLQQMGVEVLTGSDLGIAPPENQLVTIFKFRSSTPSLRALKNRWDAVVEALPKKVLPQGVRALSVGSEEFAARYAPHHVSLDGMYERYLDYVKKLVAKT